MSLEEAVNERVCFLMEQIYPSNREIENKSLQVQVDTLRSADAEKAAMLILQRKKQLESCTDISKIEEIYSQLDALEWLQRQVEASINES
jgi:hypothetical protein